MHEVLVNRLGGLSLPRKSVVRLTDHPDMTLDVYRGRKTTTQQDNNCVNMVLNFFSLKLLMVLNLSVCYSILQTESHLYLSNLCYSNLQTGPHLYLSNLCYSILQTGSHLYLQASHLLQSSQRRPYVRAGAILYKNE